MILSSFFSSKFTKKLVIRSVKSFKKRDTRKSVFFFIKKKFFLGLKRCQKCEDLAHVFTLSFFSEYFQTTKIFECWVGLNAYRIIERRLRSGNFLASWLFCPINEGLLTGSTVRADECSSRTVATVGVPAEATDSPIFASIRRTRIRLA